MKVHFQNRQRKYRIDRKSCEKAVSLLCDFLKIDCQEVGIHFVSVRMISDLHDRFFEDPSPTDCISFPVDQLYLGDIFVCPEVAFTYAKAHSLDPFDEILLYIVHGMLHLIGMDDQTPKEKRTMRKKEKRCMDYLKSQRISLSP